MKYSLEMCSQNMEREKYCKTQGKEEATTDWADATLEHLFFMPSFAPILFHSWTSQPEEALVLMEHLGAFNHHYSNNTIC